MKGTRPLRVLLVDDEPIARRSLRRVLDARGDVRIAGECRNGEDAVRAIWEVEPDLVLLDVQMPGLDGFDVLREVGVQAMPAVVFVTAFDEFAVRAFDAAAVDYVVKPYTDARLALAVDRAIAQRRARETVALNLRLLAALGSQDVGEARALTRLLVRAGSRRLVVELNDVDVIRADDYCTRVIVRGYAYVVRRSLRDFERRLDPAVFVRTHRSAIVRLAAVRAIERTPRGEHVVLHDGTRAPVARARRVAVRAALGDLAD